MVHTSFTNETDLFSRVRVRLLLEHERPRFDQLIEEQHYLHTSVLLGHPPGACPVPFVAAPKPTKPTATSDAAGDEETHGSPVGLQGSAPVAPTDRMPAAREPTNHP